LLDVLEQELRTSGEPSPCDVRFDSPLLERIIDSIITSGTGMYLVEPTSACLYETLNGYWCGLIAFDLADAERQRRTMTRFESWLREKYDPAAAPWHAILRAYEGAAVLQTFSLLYKQFQAVMDF
jgi:hypothetical protein